MVALTIGGRLASCVSCVEYFYFQSTANASLFLEACASAGLLQKMPLLDLFGDVGPRSDPGQRRYDEPIFLSAPEYQAQHADAARNRLERTKSAVDLALRIFYEELRGDQAMVAAAYRAAIQQKKLRFSDVAELRLEVKLSAVAKVRLILDGFRALHSGDRSSPRLIVQETIRFIRDFAGAADSNDPSHDVGNELDDFIIEFITSPEKIHGTEAVTLLSLKLETDYWIKWLPVVLNLAWGRFAALKQEHANKAEQFAASFTAAIKEAARREKNTAAGEQLVSLTHEWEWMETRPTDTDLPPWLSPILNPTINLPSS